MHDADLDTHRSAAASGDPEALYRLGSALVLRQAMDEAFALHRRAAEAGHVLAQIEHARMLLYGIGTDPAAEAAAHWLLRAEVAGHPVAGYYLALIAVGGLALPRDAAMNRRLQAAVQAGFPPAMRAAALHFGRKPHPDDQSLCLRLLEDAAARGDALCAALLVERLARGEGVPADPAAAERLRAPLQAAGMPALPQFAAPPPQQAPCEPRTLELRDALYAPAVQAQSARPRVAVIDRLLSADECRLLIAASQPMLRGSQTVDPQTGLPIAIPLRTSSDASVDPVAEDLALRLVQLRIAAAAGVDLPHAEHLTVLRYAPGQEYRPHRDYVPPGAVERDRPEAGNRARTICVYLNAVAAGGDTEFPLAGVRIAPAPGRAVVFDNLHSDGRPDPDSLHAGLPVERGEKWLATLWLRERAYRHY